MTDRWTANQNHQPIDAASGSPQVVWCWLSLHLSVGLLHHAPSPLSLSLSSGDGDRLSLSFSLLGSLFVIYPLFPFSLFIVMLLIAMYVR